MAITEAVRNVLDAAASRDPPQFDSPQHRSGSQLPNILLDFDMNRARREGITLDRRPRARLNLARADAKSAPGLRKIGRGLRR